MAGCRYAVAVIVGARAKDLENKIPSLLNGSGNLAIDYAANEVLRGEVIGVSSK
jgi:DNA-directed RNA polymerase subunit K/omega